MDMLQSTWERYVSTWKTPEADKMAIYESCLAPDCVYTDPLATTKNYTELDAYMAQFHQQVPGGHFVTTSFFAHHNKSIANWEMRDGNDTVIGSGASYGEYDGDGKLVQITGFFEVPSAAS